MLNRIIDFSIKNKLLILLFTFAFIGFGIYETTKLPIDAVPDITDNQVQVITYSPSLGAPDIERQITFPIEQSVGNISGLKEIRSFSRFGLSLITIVFNDDVDIYWARQQVTEKINSVKSQIPEGVGEPELAPVTTGLGEIYQYVLRPEKGYEDKYTATELRTIQDWVVKRQLMGVKGVADVSSFGGKVKQYEIAINPAVLNSYQISINDIFDALQNNNENTGGAYIERKSTVLYIRSEGLIGSLEDIQNIVVKKIPSGAPIFIKDVADVRIGNATRYGAITYNDEGEVAGAVVMMLKGANSSEVIKDVKERITEIKKTLPKGVIIEPFLDRTKMVDSAISTVTKNLIEGALIVVFILVLFLGNFRAGFIVASVIPLALLFAIVMMNIFGVSGNLMSLGALDFGLIIDGAVIIVEAVMFQMHHTATKNMSQQKMDSIVYNTSVRMRNAAIFGELIILAVYLPIFTLQGIEGKMFIPMAQTVAFALLGAFILSLTYIPVMCAIFLKKESKKGENFSDRMMAKLEAIHRGMLEKVLSASKLTLISVSALFVISLFIFSKMGGEFIPELPEGDFAVETRVLPGSNLKTSSEAILKAAGILQKKFPEIEKIVGKSGSGEIPTDPMPMEASDMMIILKDKKEWSSAKSWNELADKMQEELKAIPGVTFSFQFPVAMRFNELMTGAKQDVVCKIFGENLDSLSHYSARLGRIAQKVDGVKDIYVEPIDGLPQLIINYNRNALAMYNLSIKDVNRIVNTALAGQSAGLVFEDEKRFDLVVRLGSEQKQNVEDIQNLLIPTENGTQIPLNQIADVSVKESVSQIQRDDTKRRVLVGFNVGDRDVQSIVTDLQKKVDTELNLPSGYYVEYGGAFENLVNAQNRLAIAVPVALLIIFALLYFAFKSVKQAALIFTAIPLSAMGGILSLFLRGMPFSISAGIGFIALFGVAVLNGIVLITEFNRIRKEGETDSRKIVLQGTKIRLRPVLMTALVASLGFLPMALSGGAGAEVQRPLATVVIGGLLVATFLTLFILPILYIIFEDKIHININKNKTGTIAGILLIFAGSTFANAQSKITLDEALQIAETNSLQIKNSKLNADYLNKLTNTAYDIPNTAIGTEMGQFNSPTFDMKVGVSQSVKLPSAYKSQKNLLEEEAKNGNLLTAKDAKNLKALVAASFYQLIYLDEKKKYLKGVVKVFQDFSERANLRLKLGESDIIEKSSAENQLLKNSIKLEELNYQYEKELHTFNYLLNASEQYVPQGDFYALNLPELSIDEIVANNPDILLLEQEKNINGAKIEVERSKKKPDLNGGVYYQTFRNSLPNNNNLSGVYGAVGISLPIFNSVTNKKIEALQISNEIANNKIEMEKLRWTKEYNTLVSQYENQKKIVNHYKMTATTNIKIIVDAANQKLYGGDINFIQWTTLINQNFEIQENYIEAVKNLNTMGVSLINLLNTNTK